MSQPIRGKGGHFPDRPAKHKHGRGCVDSAFVISLNTIQQFLRRSRNGLIYAGLTTDGWKDDGRGAMK